MNMRRPASYAHRLRPVVPDVTAIRRGCPVCAGFCACGRKAELEDFLYG